MEFEEIKAALIKWAQTESIVTKVYIFGSRLKGTHRPDSDLDIAIELQKLPGDETVTATWICEAGRLKNSIKSYLPYAIDLQGYNGEETPHLHTYLEEASLLVYEANPTETNVSRSHTHCFQTNQRSDFNA